MTLWIPGRCVVSHRSAGATWGFPGITPDLLEVTIDRRRSASGIVLHTTDQLESIDLARLGALTLTTPTRTLIDLGAVMGEEEVEIAFDHALVKKLTNFERVLRRHDALRGKGRNGTGVMAKILAERDGSEGVPESPAETRFFRFLRRRVPRPVPQFPEGKYRIDLAYPEEKVAIEIDSVTFHNGEEPMGKERVKHNYLQSVGWRVVRFMAHDSRDKPDYVEATVREARSAGALF